MSELIKDKKYYQKGTGNWLTHNDDEPALPGWKVFTNSSGEKIYLRPEDIDGSFDFSKEEPE